MPGDAVGASRWLWAVLRDEQGDKEACQDENTGMRNACMKATSKSAAGVVLLSRQGSTEGPVM
jgi:hypothetical protein